MKKLLVYALSFFVLSTACANARPARLPHVINVSGEAHEEVAPDQAVLSLSLTSRDPVLNKAKSANDQQVERLVAITRKFDIPKEKILTSNVNISPEYTYDNATAKQNFSGYMVSRSLRITIDKIALQEPILSAVVDAKVDQINGVEFQLSDPKPHSEKLRLEAFQCAKDKATALAKASGQALGEAIRITTNGGPQRNPRPMPMMMAAKAMGEGADMSVAPSLPGTITLSESVSVTFELVEPDDDKTK